MCFDIFYKRDVPAEISLGWNKVSGCHTKPTSVIFCRSDNAFSQSFFCVPTWIRKAVISKLINS